MPGIFTTISKSTAFNVCGYVSRFLDILRRNPVDFSISLLVDYCTHFASIREKMRETCTNHDILKSTGFLRKISRNLETYPQILKAVDLEIVVIMQVSNYAWLILDYAYNLELATHNLKNARIGPNH